MKRAFTLLELLLAISLLGVMTAIAVVTFRAVTNGWIVSCEYVDRLERTDYAVDQLISALRCAYYPHGGEQNGDYGFMLTDNGDGDSPRESDVIEWTKVGPALIGSDVASHSAHRIQVKVMEEGDSWGRDRIERTGLYARVRPLAAIMAGDSMHEEEDFTFESEELYRPILIAKDVDGFNCRVQPTVPQEVEGKKKSDKESFEDEFDASNSVPYKVQLTLYLLKEDPEYASRRQRVPLVRVIRMPVHQQSLDGAGLPGDESGGSGTKGGDKKRPPAGGGGGR